MNASVPISVVTHTLDDEAALIQAVKAGDVAAFEAVVEKYDRQVFRIANHITQHPEDAEDVAQETFLKAFQKLPQFEGRSKFSTWLIRIAENQALMKLRKCRRSKLVSIDVDISVDEGLVPRDVVDWAPNPEQLYSRSELHDIVVTAAQTLWPGLRAVFVLCDVEAFSMKGAAETLDMSVPAVKSRLLRARLQLREVLNRYFERVPTGGR